MRQERFEELALQLWMTTRVPMTRANLLFYTRAPRRKLDAWLDELVRDSVLDVDSDDAGEMTWVVRGAQRPKVGSDRIEDVVRLQHLKGEVSSTGGAASSLASLSRQLGRLDRAANGREGSKSLVLSGALSFFFGPLGWLYAGSLREAVPASGLYLLLLMTGLLHYFYFFPLIGLATPISAIVGVLYAMRHNEAGRRAPLLLDDSDDGPRALPGRR